jgi:hypothetical protein
MVFREGFFCKRLIKESPQSRESSTSKQWEGGALFKFAISVLRMLVDVG